MLARIKYIHVGACRIPSYGHQNRLFVTLNSKCYVKNLLDRILGFERTKMFSYIHCCNRLSKLVIVGNNGLICMHRKVRNVHVVVT